MPNCKPTWTSFTPISAFKQHPQCGDTQGGNMKTRITALLLGTALAFGAASGAWAQDKTAKIGVLTDLSGLYADLGGQGSIVAAEMAIEDSGMKAKGWKIEMISADHQNKPDIATGIARRWIDTDKVDVFVDV